MKNPYIQHLPHVSGIYKITNLKTNKVYIGSSKDIRHRIISHISALRKNNHGNSYLQNSFNKEGIDNFKFEILESNILNLEEREDFYITFYKSYKRNIGYNLSRYANFLKNKRTFKQIESTAKTKRITVLQFSKNGILIKEWDSAALVEKELNYKNAHISACCYDKYGCKTYKNYIWIFKKDFTEDYLKQRILKARSVKGKRLNKYDLLGNLLHIYNSISEASKIEGPCRKSFRKSLNDFGEFKLKNTIFKWD